MTQLGKRLQEQETVASVSDVQTGMPWEVTASLMRLEPS